MGRSNILQPAAMAMGAYAPFLMTYAFQARARNVAVSVPQAQATRSVKPGDGCSLVAFQAVGLLNLGTVTSCRVPADMHCFLTCPQSPEVCPCEMWPGLQIVYNKRGAGPR